ncbi:MAG: carboxylating nicotinate-nucleotide diphosphorylase [Candidatus Diapherotrites archaeon]
MLPPGMQRRLLSFLEDDISVSDITSSVVPERRCNARITLKENAVLAGLEEAAFLLENRGCGVKVHAGAKDGTQAKAGTVVLEISGMNRSILETERTALNILGRMSGVATACAQAVKIAKPCRVALTRKIMPGMNAFERRAALLGGADTHRFNLADMVLIKSNHLVFFGSVGEAVKAAKEKTSFSKKIEIEVRTRTEALEAARAEPDIIMLDNFPLAEAKAAISEIKRINPHVLVEFSGGINMKNLADYAALKPDVISMGALTKSAHSVDFSLSMQGAK